MFPSMCEMEPGIAAAGKFVDWASGRGGGGWEEKKKIPLRTADFWAKS